MPIHISPSTKDFGELSAHLFENANTGVRRGIYWSVELPCASVSWGDDDWETSLNCEWLGWEVQNWFDLDGATLKSTTDPASAECSFYLAQHHEIDLSDVTLAHIPNSTRFLIRIAGVINVHGFEDLDGRSAFSIESEAEFTGLIVVPDNLFPKPSTELEATSELAKFISLSGLAPAEWDGFRYVYAPARCASDA